MQKTVALKLNRIGYPVVVQPLPFYHVLSIIEYSLSLFLSVFFFIIALMQGPLNIISHC